MHIASISLLSLIILCFTSCKVNPSYEVTGVIINKNTLNRVMTIDHDKIEGFMEPMVMDLNVHYKVNMDKIKIMDSVSFNLIITEDSHYTTNFQKLGVRYSNNDDDNDIWINDIYSVKQPGEKFNNVTFSKSDNTEYTLYDSNKDFIIISYIFSRCPIPNMCPAVISKNQF